MADFEYNKAQMLKYYGSANIQFTKIVSIDENNMLSSQENLNNLLNAAAYLDDMINEKGLKVYVNCASGHTRAMSVIMVYLAFYKKHQDWNDLERLSKKLQQEYPMSFPNMKAVEKIIQ